MAIATPLQSEQIAVEHEESQLHSTWRRFRSHKLALLALFILSLMVVLVATAQWWTPYDPNSIAGFASGADKFAPPGYVNPHNGDVYILGTDYIGRDVLSRLAYGGQISLSIGLLCALATSIIGIIVGSSAGYFGGRVDSMLMGLVDLVLALPFLQIMIVFSLLLGPYYWSMFLIITMLGWAGTARLVRGTFLSLRNFDFVEATRALGASNWRIIVRHLLPNAFAPVIVDATLNVGIFIVAESSVSFLGFGITEPTSSWGNILAWLNDMVISAPLQIIWPGLLIFISVVSVNLIGDALRDALDVRNRI
jgi:peptide/nickel transport system permease protein